MAISVVTCCMNRNDHLAQTIPQWFARDWVDEVIVVDWSSAVPVAETLRDMRNDKIRIVRAEGEAHWVLALAFNLGILHATGDTILKVDADCFVDDRLLLDGHADETCFYAGDTDSARLLGRNGSVNGQCLFTRAAFEAVNGFNELLRGWGWDDHDFYRRFQARGLTRLELDCRLFDFIDHSNEDRVLHTPPSGACSPTQALFERQMVVQDWKNRIIVEQMPWGPWFPRARYRRLGASGAMTTVERLRAFDLSIPPALVDFARLEAGRHALRRLLIDEATITSATDYPAVIAIFEDWIRRTAAPTGNRAAA